MKYFSFARGIWLIFLLRGRRLNQGLRDSDHQRTCTYPRWWTSEAWGREIKFPGISTSKTWWTYATILQNNPVEQNPTSDVYYEAHNLVDFLPTFQTTTLLLFSRQTSHNPGAGRIIERCSSPYRSPIVEVQKKDNRPRFCVDYRRLNRIKVDTIQTIPRIDDARKETSTAKIFSKSIWKVATSKLS